MTATATKMNAITITLPDGSTRAFDQPVSVQTVAADIGAGLAKATLAGRVNDTLVDASFVIEQDATLAIITSKNEEGLEILRHSTAHLLAHAVKRLFPKAQVTIGPVIDDGFFYDFAFERAFTPEDLSAIEKEMTKIVKEGIEVVRRELPRDEAIAFFRDMGEEYKAKIIEDLPEGEILSLYKQDDFEDLCRGPHVSNTSKLGVFKLTKVAGAYWRGDASNEMLQRIYGTAWPDKKALKGYLHRLEEAEKRDHRKIGKAMDLFSIQEQAGGGLVFWHPQGARMRRVIEDYWRDRHVADDYELLYTPHIALQTLWNTSGHTDFYADGMYKPMVEDEQLYQLKPMNCPFHVLTYKNTNRSYRDLPMKWGELGTVYRHEMSGALHGLMRVRGFTQDDAHVFCRESQIADEISDVLDLALSMLADFGFANYHIELSTRPEKYVGDLATWDKAEASLEEALKRSGLEYNINPADGAFYGPKIDLTIEDAIGRRWQCSTIQLDFNLPERFDMTYTGEDGAKHRPIMIHRALLGSIERFFGVMIEHYAGKFPPWLAPTQAVVMNITDNQAEYAKKVVKNLKKSGFRAELDLRNEKISYKIREHTLARVPYLLTVGDAEVENQTVAVRTRAGVQVGTLSWSEFEDRLAADVAKRGRFDFDATE